jgi:hypothetical protein
VTPEGPSVDPRWPKGPPAAFCWKPFWPPKVIPTGPHGRAQPCGPVGMLWGHKWVLNRCSPEGPKWGRMGSSVFFSNSLLTFFRWHDLACACGTRWETTKTTSCIHTHIYICAYIRTSIHTDMHTCIHTYIHTYIHTTHMHKFISQAYTFIYLGTSHRK